MLHRKLALKSETPNYLITGGKHLRQDQSCERWQNWTNHAYTLSL